MKKVILIIMVMTMLFGLSGCKDAIHYKMAEKAALSYYKKKYGERSVEIVDSFKAGNSSLFGYVGVKDRAYEMSDHYFVFYDDDQGRYYDNRQEASVIADFDSGIFQPLLRDDVRMKTSEYSLGRTHMESFDECVYTTYYDGDMRSFLEKEKPVLSDMRILMEEKKGFDHEAYIRELYEKLDPYVSGYMQVIVVEKDHTLFDGDLSDAWIRNGDEGVTVIAQLYFGDKISWYRQKYIEVFDGVYVCSNRPNFDLEEGDIVFEEAGKASELQKLLDEAYEAMPVDAKENEKGGYQVHDQRHEYRTIIDEPDLPYYRLKISDRVLEEIGEGRLDVYMKIMDGKGSKLFANYAYSNSRYSLYKVCEDGGSLAYEQIDPGNLYYFGSYHSEEYKDKE